MNFIRCRISECGESGKNSQFEPIWLMNAVPKSGSDYSSCLRYGHDGSNGSLEYCPPDMFNRDNVTACDSYVYGKNNSVVYDVSMSFFIRYCLALIYQLLIVCVRFYLDRI